MEWQPKLARELVGRANQQSRLHDLWVAGGAFVVVQGAAGVGKSRLVRELAASVKTAGAPLLVGRCTEASIEVPLRSIADALLGAARAGVVPPSSLGAFVPALARLVPEWGASEGADRSPLVLGEGVLRLASSLAVDGAPALIVIEDLQWADRESVTVLEFLADGLAGQHLTVVATCRDDGDGPGAELVGRMTRARQAVNVDIGPLTLDGVRAMARACLHPEQPSDDLVAVLFDRSEGVPFVIEELLTTTRSLEPDALDQAIPKSIAASVAARMDELPESAARVVRTAAMLGRQFDWAVAVDAADVEQSAGFIEVWSSQVRPLIERDGSGFRFRHAMTRDAVLANVLPQQRVEVAQRSLAALRKRDPMLDGERLQLAAWLADQAGDSDAASALFTRAAERALVEGSLASARVLAERAFALAASTRHNAESAPPFELVRVLLAVWTQVAEFERVAALGRSILPTLRDPAAEIEIHVLMASAAIGAGLWADAERHVETAKVLVGADDRDTVLSVRLEVLAAQTALGQNDAERAVALASGVIDREPIVGDAPWRCEALEVIGRVERLREPSSAERAFSRALEIARQNRLQVWEIRAMQELGAVDLYTNLSAVRLEAARASAAAAGAVTTAAVIDLQLAATYGERMDLDDAVASARRCQDASRRFHLPTLAMALALEAAAHGRAGRRVEMEHAATQARAVGYDAVTVEATLAGLAESSLRLHQADLHAAVAALDRSMVWIRQTPIVGFPFPGLWALLRTVLGSDGEDARSEVRALQFDTPMSRAMVVAGDAVAAGAAGDLVSAGRDFEQADAMLAAYQRGYRRHLMRWLVAGRAAEDGWGAPAAWLRESLAGFESLDMAGPARACRAELRDMGIAVPRHGRGEAVVPPHLASLGITSREMDVLAHLGEGCTNREIADRLYLSPRTVEKHVERLAMKAQTNREGLSQLARANPGSGSRT